MASADYSPMDVQPAIRLKMSAQQKYPRTVYVNNQGKPYNVEALTTPESGDLAILLQFVEYEDGSSWKRP